MARIESIRTDIETIADEGDGGMCLPMETGMDLAAFETPVKVIN